AQNSAQKRARLRSQNFIGKRIWGYARQKHRKSCRISEYFNEVIAQNPSAKIEFGYARYA
ncbi:MAG: hypothetical protein IKZ47_01290, partial [Clostridia bacterium]|nr:hypothetical protein [Clostridia bacterium]